MSQKSISLHKDPRAKPVFILNGFDRCGSSAISRTLGQHPQVELLFQPFNSGSIRRKMYQILDDEIASANDYKFFEGLAQGDLYEDYIKSQWHFKYSTTRELLPGRLHLIKTTINHFTAEWQQKHFPSIPLWGIWREPENILRSILRNNFTEQWYEGAIDEIKPMLSQRRFLNVYNDFLPNLNSAENITAFLIAVRSHYFFYNIPVERILKYESFVDSPNRELSKVCLAFGLQQFDFDIFAKKDLNVIGKAYKANAKEANGFESNRVVDEIFQPLRGVFHG